MKARAKTGSKGFTLIELLIVIGIVVILAIAAVLTLNPAELLRQARDSNRVNDLGTVKSALALYLADVTAPDLGSNTYCFTAVTGLTSPTCSARFAAGTNSTTISTAITSVGWIPVNFSAISAGSPISSEPVDPVNTSATQLFYAYRPSAAGFTYELNANMESGKYSAGGASDSEGRDGGSSSTIYEVGTAPGLAL